MDKLLRCKLLLLTEYFAYLRKLQKGHTDYKYNKLIDSMINLENLDLSTIWQREAILDSIATRLMTTEPFSVKTTTSVPVIQVNWSDLLGWNDSSVWTDL